MENLASEHFLDVDGWDCVNYSKIVFLDRNVRGRGRKWAAKILESCVI